MKINFRVIACYEMWEPLWDVMEVLHPNKRHAFSSGYLKALMKKFKDMKI